MIDLITGGAASGKSAYAEQLALSLASGKPVIYLATMHNDGHPETLERIERHRSMRRDKGFETVEAESHVERLLEELGDGHPVILLEDLSNLLTNEMYKEHRGIAEILSGILSLGERAELVIVTNEIFSDGRSYDEFTEEFIQHLAKLNRIIAGNALCRSFTEVVAGLPVRLYEKAY